MLIALLAGAVLGITLGTVGGGGAILAVPVLVYLLGQSVHAATTESLIVVLGASGAGAVGHARQGAVCWRLAGLFAAAAIPGSVAGTLANRAVSPTALLVAFALLLLAVAGLTWWRSVRRAAETDDACPAPPLVPVLAAGLATGALTGLLGVGGGFAIVPALALLLHVPLRRAVGTSLVIVAIVGLAGTVEHLLAGAQVAWGTALAFAAAGMLTASFGGAIAARLPGHLLARGFAAVLGVVATYLLVSVTLLGGPPQG